MTGSFGADIAPKLPISPPEAAPPRGKTFFIEAVRERDRLIACSFGRSPQR
jgi:hypothetical protein